MPAEYNCVHDGSITIDWYCFDLYRLRNEIIPWAICINVKLNQFVWFMYVGCDSAVSLRGQLFVTFPSA